MDCNGVYDVTVYHISKWYVHIRIIGILLADLIWFDTKREAAHLKLFRWLHPRRVRHKVALRSHENPGILRPPMRPMLGRAWETSGFFKSSMLLTLAPNSKSASVPGLCSASECKGFGGAKRKLHRSPSRKGNPKDKLNTFHSKNPLPRSEASAVLRKVKGCVNSCKFQMKQVRDCSRSLINISHHVHCTELAARFSFQVYKSPGVQTCLK